MTARPYPIVPTPAAGFASLRGLRVIVGVPGIGFRADLRADDPVVHGGRTYIPVLTEHDYYRAESDHIEAFAPLVPIERVWVEQAAWAGGNPGRATPLDAPQRREPVPAASSPHLTGRRLVRAVPDGHVRDLRAVTEVYAGATGGAVVRVSAEAEWYGWARCGQAPSTIEVEAGELWIE